MALTYRQKRLLLTIGEPILRGLYGFYRLVTLDYFRDHSLPTDSEEEHVRKILVVRLDTIGDVLLSEPAIAALKRRFPKAQLHVVANSAGIAVLGNNPHIDAFYQYEAPWHAAWRGRPVRWSAEVRPLLSLLHRLRREKYDLAFELRGDVRDIAFMAATGARVKIGSGWRGGAFLLDHEAPVDPTSHRVKFALGIVATVGARPAERTPRLYPSARDYRTTEKALASLANGSTLIAFHLGAGFASKCLPIEKFVQVAKQLSQPDGQHPRQIVVVGGKEDEPLVAAFQNRLPFRPLNLVGRLSLLETAAVLERCDLFVGNDSAPMHIAASVGTPIVTFFGPSEPTKYHPYGVDYRLLEIDLFCRPCDHIHCVHKEYLCMLGIPAEGIVAAAEELLSRPRASRRHRVVEGVRS